MDDELKEIISNTNIIFLEGDLTDIIYLCL